MMPRLRDAAAAVKLEVMAAPAGSDELDGADIDESLTPLACILTLCRFKKYL